MFRFGLLVGKIKIADQLPQGFIIILVFHPLVGRKTGGSAIIQGGDIPYRNLPDQKPA